MQKIRVGVIRGGLGSEYYVSLRTGSHVLANLPRDRYEPHDILVTQGGEWHIDGVPIRPAKLSQYIDVAFNALHGEFGEDGKVQNILELFGVPYTGSTATPSAIGMNKELAKKQFAAAGLKVPRGVIVSRGDEIEEVAARVRGAIHAPYIVKPLSGGSSVGLSLVQGESELVPALERALSYGEKALVEEYMRGREITVVGADGADGLSAYTMPPLEVLLPESTVFDYEQKYRSSVQPVGPARMHEAERQILEEAALCAHRQLGARHYASYDFVITDEGPCLLEVNTLPGLTEMSLFPKALAARNLSMPEFLDYVLGLALQKK